MKADARGGGRGAGTPGRHRLAVVIAMLAVVAGMQTLLAPGAGAVDFVAISGSGSTWSANALDQWRRNVANQDGITVNFSPNGSSNGRNDFRLGLVDFAVSELPYGPTSGSADPSPTRAFGYMPIVAGGLSFMYNLKIGNTRVTNLRLSGETLTKIFTQVITNWADPAIKADNPGLSLPDRAIVPVVHSEGAGTTAQLTAWMASQYPGLWDDYCHRAGRDITPCGSTPFYPLTPTMTAKTASPGVAGFVAQDSSEGAITYVEYFYARNVVFPVVKMLNAANYYVAPTATNVAVALLKAQLHPDLTEDLSQVYVNPDPRAYPLSSYAYMIVPKDTSANFTTEKGRTLSEFAYYFLCDGQQQADALGYAPLPVNLVQAGVDQAGQVPGSTHKLDRNNLQGCRNPTLSPDGTDQLGATAPQPDPCDRNGAPAPCPGATSRATNTSLVVTPTSPVPAGTTETLTATVTAVPTGPSPVGSVQFKDGDTNLGSASTGSDGTATVTTTLPPGTHFLAAVFTPADPAAFGSSTSATSPTPVYVVNAPTATATTTTLIVFSHRASAGFPVGFLAYVRPRAATGTIQFMDGTTTLGAPVPVTVGFALLITSLPAGTHSLSAVFTPDAPMDFAPSVSPPVSLKVRSLFAVPGR